MNLLWFLLGSVLLAVIGDLVSAEVRHWLACLPRLILRLAARRMPVAERKSRLDEWRGELDAILDPQAGAPLTQLAVGLRYAVGLAWSSGSIRRKLGPGRPDSEWRELVDAGRRAAIYVLVGLAPGLVALSGLGFYLGEHFGAADAFVWMGLGLLAEGLALSLSQVFGARILVWGGGTLFVVSTMVPTTDNLGWRGVALLVSAALTLVSATVGCFYARLRRRAAALMTASPLVITVLAFITLLELWGDSSLLDKSVRGLLIVAMAALSVRYLRIAAGQAPWIEGNVTIRELLRQGHQALRTLLRRGTVEPRRR